MPIPSVAAPLREAVANLGEHLIAFSRSPEIVSRPAHEVTGYCYIDEQVLTTAGRYDVSRYAVGPSPSRTCSSARKRRMTDHPAAERTVVQRGLWFDEFETGVRYLHRPGRTITEADNVLFTTLTMNTQAMHLDAAFAAGQPPFHQRLVNSMFTLSTLVGLSVAQLTQGTIVANLGFADIAFPHPLFHGDTLYAETLVIDKRLSRSRSGEGIVTLEHTGRNQHGDVVAIATRKTLVRTNPEAGG